MGEIKSTLDIIMEKTKNLIITDEEKKAFREKEMRGKVKGLLQRFADGIITRQRLMEDAALLEGDSRDKVMVRRFLVEEALGHMGPGRDNAPFLGVLEMVPGTNAGEVREILAGFEKELQGYRTAQMERLNSDLKKKGISGSAVVPNLEVDPGWKTAVEGMEREMREKMAHAAWQ